MNSTSPLHPKFGFGISIERSNEILLERNEAATTFLDGNGEEALNKFTLEDICKNDSEKSWIKALIANDTDFDALCWELLLI